MNQKEIKNQLITSILGVLLLFVLAFIVISHDNKDSQLEIHTPKDTYYVDLESLIVRKASDAKPIYFNKWSELKEFINTQTLSDLK